MRLIRVRANSHTNAVAGAIAGMVRNGEPLELQAIGPSAVNQVVKAIATFTTTCRPTEPPRGLSCRPSFVEIDIDGQERTAIRFTVTASPENLG